VGDAAGELSDRFHLLGLPQGFGRRHQLCRPFFHLGFEGRVRRSSSRP
jgi:hypothetical protein